MGLTKLLCVLFSLIIMTGFIGCGGGSSTTTSDSTGNVTISGTLSTGAIGVMSFSRAEGIRPMAVDEYTVVAIDNSSNKTYNTTASAGTEFSLEVPPDTTYLVSIIKNGSYLGPTVFAGSGTEVNTAFTPISNSALGSITVDSTNGFARTSTAPGSVNTSIISNSVGGKPLGALNDGKTKNGGITNRSDSDTDRDGIPNIFDADEDNDGIRNGIISVPSSKAVVSSVVESVYMSSNIWADHDTTDSAEDLIDLRLHVVPITGQESLIASVQCTGVPSSISSLAIIRVADSVGNPTSYPNEDDLWSADSYNLYKTTTLPDEEWIVSITPKAIMNVGDIFTIRVTYTDATYEDFFVSTSYVLTDWARISTYNGTAMPTGAGSAGTSTTPVTYSNNTLTIVFSKPRDEDGDVLTGLSYSMRYAVSTYDGGAGRWLVPGTVTEDSNVTDNGDTITFAVPTPDLETYYVTPVAESADGQRNGEETWFTRQ